MSRDQVSKNDPVSPKPALSIAAVVSIRHHPDIKRQFERSLKNGNSKLSAIGAAIRKWGHICFGVLKHQVPYQVQTQEN